MWSIVRRTINCHSHVIGAVGETVRSRIGSCAGAASRRTAAIGNLGGPGDRGAIRGGLLQALLIAQETHVDSEACRQDEDSKAHGGQH